MILHLDCYLLLGVPRDTEPEQDSASLRGEPIPFGLPISYAAPL